MSTSDRQSDRVDSPLAISAGKAAAAVLSAPETMASASVRRSRSAERRPRLSGQQLREIAANLSERDRAVLMSVDRFGFLRSHQVEQLHFDAHSTPESAARICRRSLSRLRRLGLLDTLERRIGGLRAGSASYVWRLSAAGDRLLRDGNADAPRARRKEPSVRFLDHRLAVADCHCRLVEADRAAIVELLSAAPEPGSWRLFIGNHGAREILKPDLAAITAIGDYEDHWFFEIDLGTESLPTVLRQCQRYESYRHTGQEQQAHGLFPRVVWLVPDERRRQRVRAAIDGATHLNSDLFVVETFEALRDVVGDNQINAEPKGGDLHDQQPNRDRS